MAQLQELCRGRTAPDSRTSDTLLSAYHGTAVPHVGSPAEETLHNWQVLSGLLARFGDDTVDVRTANLLCMIRSAGQYAKRHCNATDAARQSLAHLRQWKDAVTRFRQLARFD